MSVSSIGDKENGDEIIGVGSVEFDPRGNPTNGVIVLMDEEGKRYTILLKAATGRLTTIKEDEC